MSKIKDIMDYIEGFAPLSLAMEFDNVGLLVGDCDTQVDTVLVALDNTPEVIDEAGLIISHHPVIFEPLKSIGTDSPVYGLIKNGISALCLHTNLDLSPVFGVNTCLAEAVGVKDGAFVEGECLYIGELDSEMTNRDFALKVKTALGCDGLRLTMPDKTVKKVALCSGSGGDLAPLAASLGADVLLTGEIKHHQILDANSAGIAVLDAGHFRSEDVVTAPFAERLNSKFNDIKFIRSEACTDGISYI